jgi:hypothetical protein
MFGVNSFDLLRAETYLKTPRGLLFSAEKDKAIDDSKPEFGGTVGDVGQMSAPDGEGNCPPCMKWGKTEASDEKGNSIEKDVCVPACDPAKNEVCYIHPCVNKQGWTCLYPQSVSGGGSRIVFPTNLTTTCGEQGFTGNGKACPCVVCNNQESINNCQGDCTTCGGVQGATNTSQGLNGQALCGNAIGNVLVTGAGQGQGVVRTPPRGKQWGFIESPSGCNCPAGQQKVDDPDNKGRKKCVNVGCTDPNAENYDPNATARCNEGTMWPNSCCTYEQSTTSCSDTTACNRHFTDGANMDCMRLGNNCEPICADSRSVDYAGWQAESSAKTLKELYYYEESAKYDWSQSGKAVGTKERWTTMTSKLSGADSQARQNLANQAYDLFFKQCACGEGEAWDNTTGMCKKLGCTDTRACNWDSSAKVDDGSCEFGSCNGCMIIGSKNYDPNATIPCENDAGKQTCCTQTDTSPIPNSCTYDDFCRWLPSYCTGELTGCEKGYKIEGGVCKKCESNDESLECKNGCEKSSGTTVVGSSFLRGASQYKVGGVSLTTWGIIGLLAGGAYVATQN